MRAAASGPPAPPPASVGAAPPGVGPVARALGFVVGSLLRVRRAHALAAMQRAGIAAAPRQVDAMYASLGQGLLDLLSLLVRREPGRGVALPPSAWFEAVSAGRGLVVATAHTGSFDRVACALGAARPTTVISRRLHTAWLDRFWQRLRGRSGLEIVHPGAAARRALAALGEGRTVVCLVDQAPERRHGTALAPFLGAPARVDLSAALLALRARVPLVVAFPLRLADGTSAVRVTRVLEPPERPSRAWAVEALTLVTADLDALVREHPAQWLWMHRRWKDAPAAVEAGAPRRRPRRTTPEGGLLAEGAP